MSVRGKLRQTILEISITLAVVIGLCAVSSIATQWIVKLPPFAFKITRIATTLLFSVRPWAVPLLYNYNPSFQGPGFLIGIFFVAVWAINHLLLPLSCCSYAFSLKRKDVFRSGGRPILWELLSMRVMWLRVLGGLLCIMIGIYRFQFTVLYFAAAAVIEAITNTVIAGVITGLCQSSITARIVALAVINLLLPIAYLFIYLGLTVTNLHNLSGVIAFAQEGVFISVSYWIARRNK